MIDGKTRLFGIVADPIAQVRTPEAINHILQERSINGVLVPFHVTASDLETFFQGARAIKNLGGFVVTVPHKQRAADLCDEVSDAAKLVGAVNVVRRGEDGRLIGDILDGKGFVAGLQSHGINPQGKRILLLGAGGAANAIAFALAGAGVKLLGIANRTETKVEDLIARLHQLHPDLDARLTKADATGFDIVVNATALGMAQQDPLPMDITTLTDHHCVAEIIMKPEVTPLLAAAQRIGCQVHYGWPMLSSQAPLMAAFMGVEG